MGAKVDHGPFANTEMARFMVQFKAAAEGALAGLGAISVGHCASCTCHAVRIRQLATNPDRLEVSFRVDGIPCTISYHVDASNPRPPTEDQWDAIRQDIQYQVLIARRSTRSE